VEEGDRQTQSAIFTPVFH